MAHQLSKKVHTVERALSVGATLKDSSPEKKTKKPRNVQCESAGYADIAKQGGWNVMIQLHCLDKRFS